jgi:sec-independent protein translocase protein TatB
VFDSVGWPEILVLALVGLFVLGPERLPEGAAWLGKAVRQIRDYASGAREQIRSEMGDEFDQLQKPLSDLRSVRNFNPKTAVTKHLFDGENPLDDLTGNGSGSNGNGSDPSARPAESKPLAPGEPPPYDEDAT